MVPGVDRPPLVAAWVLLGAVAVGGGLFFRAEPDHEPVLVAAHTLPKVRRSADPFQRWTITEQFKAQSVMVMQIETKRLGDALAIAREAAAPLQDACSEIMIYFHRPGRPDTLPPRRVQWTRSSGFVETIFEQP